MNKLDSVKIFEIFLKTTGQLAQNPQYNWLTRYIMRLLAKITLLAKGGRHQTSVEEMAKEWQRMFPSKKFVPITKVEEETAYCEILAKCPVVGTGDVHACYRMMEYDRTLLEKIGGEFIVLESRANSENDSCKIAIRRKGDSRKDLVPAHLK